jgi:small-conductance mechanosensitive channel
MDKGDFLGITASLSIDTSTLASKLVVLVIVALVTLGVQHVAVKASRKALDVSSIPSASIFINILRAVIWTFALLVVLEPVFGVQPTAFVTALGISGVVLSLGLQDTIKNVISGLVLMTTHAIKPGDDIRLGETRGKVVDVTWRNTVLHTRAGDDLVIPNSVLNNTSFLRLSAMDACETSFKVVLAPGVDPASVSEDIRGTVAGALGEWADDAYGVLVWPSALTSYGTEVDVRVHLKPGIMWEQGVELAATSLAAKPYLSDVGAASLRRGMG